MEDNKKFPEQNAPEKNADNVFVQVGEDGKPVFPEVNSTENDSKKNEHLTTLDKR